MAGSLRNHTTNYNHHFSFVRRMISNSIADGRVIILVESSDDKAAYDPLFISSAVLIQPAPEEGGVRGCTFVESVTKSILMQKASTCIIGIRDADYTPWLLQYTRQNHIFLTEERDMEMMLLRSEKVCGDLDLVKPGATEKLKWIIEHIGRPRGQMRLLNDVLDLQCSFSDNAKISNLWVNNRLRQDWSTYLTSNFIRNCVGKYHKRKFNVKDYQTEVSVRHLNNVLWYKICQGHDVMQALQYELADSTVTIEKFMNQMVKSYCVVDFHETQLYKDLFQFSNQKGWNILK